MYSINCDISPDIKPDFVTGSSELKINREYIPSINNDYEHTIPKDLMNENKIESCEIINENFIINGEFEGLMQIKAIKAKIEIKDEMYFITTNPFNIVGHGCSMEEAIKSLAMKWSIVYEDNKNTPEEEYHPKYKHYKKLFDEYLMEVK
ncbi:MAG: hypothetical protein HPY53_04880 [Brevinematales bacterium]|nr:hypothetical protein [Brevinematales bacterium]